jgi:hypothetical protein
MGCVLEGMLRSFEHEISAQDVRATVEEGYHRLACKDDLAQDARLDLGLLENLMGELGWQMYGAPTSFETTLPSTAEFEEMSVESCFAHGVLQPGCGRYLDALSSSGTQADALIEGLLRHVEVKRQNALRKFSPILSTQAGWLERCDISILFSRFARRRGDLRFLNAALKMNEWYLKESHGASETVQARLLLALAEQELSAQELLAC